MKLLLLYTDPGSGMMLLQVLLAFVASGLFYFRRFFFGIFGRHPAPEQVTEDRDASLTHNKDGV